MIQTAILTPTGLIPTPYTADSLADAVQYEPQGVYTITRTFNRNHALLLDAHLDRLEESARLENMPCRLDRAALRAALRTLIDRSGNAESRFRITIPRADPTCVYLALENFSLLPEALKRDGVKVVTIDTSRHNPSAKTTEWMTQRKAATANLPQDIYEVVLVNEKGALLEGSSSNFYAVLKGELRTAGEGLVLSGISRKALLQAIGDLLPVCFEPITLRDVPHLTEAFLTSSSRGVIPIVEIDGQRIGDGTVGRFTRELQARYDAWTAAHLEPI